LDLKIINGSYLGVHFLLFGASERFQNIGVGWLEAEASDEITDLVEVELALAGSIVQLETVLDIFNLILGEVNLKCKLNINFSFFLTIFAAVSCRLLN
jgi:hypothetical protein